MDNPTNLQENKDNPSSSTDQIEENDKLGEEHLKDSKASTAIEGVIEETGPLDPTLTVKKAVIETVFIKKSADGGRSESNPDLTALNTEVPSENTILILQPKSCDPVNVTSLSKINQTRSNVSNVFPAGCMGCKENPVASSSSAKESLDYCSGFIENTPKLEESEPEIPEERRQAIRRRGGNPLLGVGYEDDQKRTNVGNRIPPGGFSHRLW